MYNNIFNVDFGLLQYCCKNYRKGKYFTCVSNPEMPTNCNSKNCPILGERDNMLNIYTFNFEGIHEEGYIIIAANSEKEAFNTAKEEVEFIFNVETQKKLDSSTIKLIKTVPNDSKTIVITMNDGYIEW